MKEFTLDLMTVNKPGTVTGIVFLYKDNPQRQLFNAVEKVFNGDELIIDDYGEMKWFELKTLRVKSVKNNESTTILIPTTEVMVKNNNLFRNRHIAETDFFYYVFKDEEGFKVKVIKARGYQVNPTPISIQHLL